MREKCDRLSTGHKLVESTLFPCHFKEMTRVQRGIDVELTTVPSGELCCWSNAENKARWAAISLSTLLYLKAYLKKLKRNDLVQTTTAIDRHGQKGLFISLIKINTPSSWTHSQLFLVSWQGNEWLSWIGQSTSAVQLRCFMRICQTIFLGMSTNHKWCIVSYSWMLSHDLGCEWLLDSCHIAPV